MKHFQHLWDLKYKLYATYIVTDFKSCNNFVTVQLYTAIYVTSSWSPAPLFFSRVFRMTDEALQQFV